MPPRRAPPRDVYPNEPRRNEARYDNGYGHDRYDTYRPRSRSPPPLPRYGRAPSPRRNGDDMYRFGDNNPYQNHTNGQDDFTFRSNRQPDFDPNLAPTGPRGVRNGNNNRGRNQRNHGANGNQGRRDGHQRGPYVRPPPPHDRAILKNNAERAVTPERLDGMVEGASKFKVVDDIEDVESVPSPVEEEEQQTTAEGPSKKRTRTETLAADADSKPKWSNPDPYTVLPPVDDSRAKAKDVLQLIRKAKLSAEQAADDSANAVTRNADFISFGFDDDITENAPPTKVATELIGSFHGNSSDHRNGPTSMALQGSIDDIAKVPMAIKIPTKQSFSHRQNLHPSTVLDDDDDEDEYVPALAPVSTNPAIPPRTGHLQSSNGGPPHKGKKRKFDLDRDGDIQGDWVATGRSSSTPWFVDHSKKKDVDSCFEQEIEDFYNFIKPRPFEATIREAMITRIHNALVKDPYFRKSNLRAFGSFGQGIFLPTSDMDLVLVSPAYQQQGIVSYQGNSCLYRARTALATAGVALVRDIIVIGKSKVPIIKFVDSVTKLQVDVSFDNASGLHAISTFDRWRLEWPFLPKLLAILKQFLLMRNVNEVHSGGLGGFSITCMLVSMLQHMHVQTFAAPSKANSERRDDKESPSPLLSVMLLEFFKCYGRDFDMATTGIDLDPPMKFDKTRNTKWKPVRWTIIDPNNSINDLAGGSFQAPLICDKFNETYNALERMRKELRRAGPEFRRGRSMLDLVIGGNYDLVVSQRNILRQLHEQEFGRVQDADDNRPARPVKRKKGAKHKAAGSSHDQPIELD